MLRSRKQMWAGPYLCCCGRGPCPALGSDWGSSWAPCCGTHALHRWDLCGVLGSLRAEGVPDCADCCKNHGSLQTAKKPPQWGPGDKREMGWENKTWGNITEKEGSQFRIGTRKFGTAVNHKRTGKRRDEEDVSQGEKIRTNECEGEEWAPKRSKKWNDGSKLTDKRK